MWITWASQAIGPCQAKRYSLCAKFTLTLPCIPILAYPSICCLLKWQTVIREMPFRYIVTPSIILYGCTGWPDYCMFANIISLCYSSGILATRGGLHVQRVQHLDKRWWNLHYVLFAFLYQINKRWHARKSIYHGCSVRTEISVSRDHCLASLGTASWCQTITFKTEISVHTSQPWKILIV